MSLHPISGHLDASSSRSVEMTNQFPELTTAEKVAKFSAKCFVLIAALVVGSALASAMSIPLPFVGAAIGGGISFTIAMGVIEKIDAFFAARVAQRTQPIQDDLKSLMNN